MGLSDVLNGMKNGPGGGVSSMSPSGGMSPLTMGLLAFLAAGQVMPERRGRGSRLVSAAGAADDGSFELVV